MSQRMGVVFDTPWSRRLKRDLRELEKVRENSSVLDFEVFGDPPEKYTITFKGTTLVKQPDGTVVPQEGEQKVRVELSLDYPRIMPRVEWLTPIHHPNIWGRGTVCVRDVWSPNVRLVDLVQLLWDMARLIILNPKSAYEGGRNASAEWEMLKEKYGPWPIDTRPLEDLAPRREEDEGEGEAEIFVIGEATLTANKRWERCGRTDFWGTQERGLFQRKAEAFLNPASFTLVLFVPHPENAPPGAALVERLSLLKEPPSGMSRAQLDEEIQRAVDLLPRVLQKALLGWFEAVTDLERRGLSRTEISGKFEELEPSLRNAILSGLHHFFLSDGLLFHRKGLLAIASGSPAYHHLEDLQQRFHVTQPAVVQYNLEEAINSALDEFGVNEC